MEKTVRYFVKEFKAEVGKLPANPELYAKEHATETDIVVRADDYRTARKAFSKLNPTIEKTQRMGVSGYRHIITAYELYSEPVLLDPREKEYSIKRSTMDALDHIMAMVMQLKDACSLPKDKTDEILLSLPYDNAVLANVIDRYVPEFDAAV